jgi:hypothetical protein
MPAGFDQFEGELTEPPGVNFRAHPLVRNDEYMIRKKLAYDNIPYHPREYGLVTGPFDPTGSSTPSGNAPSFRYLCFYPIPDIAYTFSGIATIRPTMVDDTNLYPLGAEVLAPVLLESVLAAWERNFIEDDGVHNDQFKVMLAMAIQRDREYSTPETVGIDVGGENKHMDSGNWHRRSGAILWEGSTIAGGPSGYL